MGVGKTPSVIKEDNTGAMFLVKNRQVSAHTKHIDVHHHFLRELNGSGVMVVEHTKSEDNISDPMTKNVIEEIFVKHIGKFLEGDVDLSRDNVKIGAK